MKISSLNKFEHRFVKIICACSSDMVNIIDELGENKNVSEFIKEYKNTKCPKCNFERNVRLITEYDNKRNFVKILRIKDYNKLQEETYNRDISIWRTLPIGSPMPQRAFYFFWNKKGEMKSKGFVAIVNRSHFYAKKQTDLLRKIEELYE